MGFGRLRPSSSLVLVLAIVLVVQGTVVRSRWSCLHHYLAGIHQSAVLPLRASGLASNVQCHIDGSTVRTEIHSALETPHFVQGKRSVNFQIQDLYHLKELIRKSECVQTLKVIWRDVPEESKGGVSLVSLLNETIRINYEEGPEQIIQLSGPQAGIRHILPDVDEYPLSSIISASSVVCEHVQSDECLVRGRVEIDVQPSPWHYEFAFRTDQSNQTLFTFESGPEHLEVRLENDFFIRVGHSAPIAIGHLTDSQWHTVAVHVTDTIQFTIDDSIQIDANRILENVKRAESLSIEVAGDVQLIDITDANNDCLFNLGDGKRLHETVNSHPLCSGCGCPLLPDLFTDLQNHLCTTSDDHSFSLHRDPDRLSFLHVPEALDFDDSGILKTAVSFKSDSDSGLVLFAYWQNSVNKGRGQVYFHFDTITGVYCSHNGEEVCMACSLTRPGGFGTDTWHDVIFWGGGDDVSLAVDQKACHLLPIDANNNVSLAEVYSVPQFVHGNGVFIGGTFYEKKQRGLYKPDIEHSFFENTREKAPSLRGCVKDVYLRGKKLNLATVYDSQKAEMLMNPGDANAFAVRYGCPKCQPGCGEARCRAKNPLSMTSLTCDCADIMKFNASGTCAARPDEKPVVLSTDFISQKQIVLPVDTTKAVLSKVWIEFTMPKQQIKDLQLVEFNSHRESLFKIIIDTNGILHVQVHGQDYESNASKQLDPTDDRVHLLVLQRRTPMGTRHVAKKYDLFIDGWHSIVSDIGKFVLNNISFVASDHTDEHGSIIVHDFGLGFDYDEHAFLLHPSNVVHQLDILTQLHPYQFREPDLSKTGNLDPSLWETPIAESFEVIPGELSSVEVAKHGDLVDYTPELFVPEQLLSARWLLYSLILTILLCLMILICIACYWCVLRGKGIKPSNSSDRTTILRDSPDYQPVKLRRDSLDSQSFDGDGSLGTDDTDLHAYRDIHSHRVKVYRESMVSILIPSLDQPVEAAIVKRDVEAGLVPSRSCLKADSPAPLVNVNED